MSKKGLEIRLLGRVEVLRNGSVEELPPSKKARALLAYLVATERAHDRGYLAGILWDEREDDRAALRWALSRLRPIVDDQTTRLVADRDRVGFERRGADVDLADVRSKLREGIDRAPTEILEEAAARFRGEFLEGLDLPDCFGFHAWCTAEREAARSLRSSILTMLVERLTSDPGRALAYARARLDLDPLSGTAQASVVRILGALGREREAEGLYQGFKQMALARRGERTSLELERARAQMRSRAPTPSATREAPAEKRERVERGEQVEQVPQVAQVERAAPPESLERLARSPFVGRESELATLNGALDAALAGAGSFVELSGEAGVGKSRLVEELAYQARLRGARVLVGRCLEGEGSPAFLPFLDGLDTALGDEADLERLVGADASLAARLSPRLASRLPQSPATASPTDATSERYLVFQAVSTLLQKVAAPAGALLVIEDLHWIDQPSLALLRYLAPRLDGTRLLVVATFRDEDVDGRGRDALVELRRYGGARVALGGLAAEDVDALLLAFGGAAASPNLRARLAEITGGHPLFLQEMLKHLVEENLLESAATSRAAHLTTVPEGVRQVIGRRLARLSERARQLLAVASGMHGACSWTLVREVSSEGEDVLLDALDEVLSAQLLREKIAGGVATYEFSHALVAQTIYESLPVPRRARLNQRIGEAIERVHATTIDAQLPALAMHFFLAAEDAASKAKAAAYAVRAADREVSLLAFEEAARHYQRALDLGEATERSRAEIHRRRGQALAVVSSWNEACEAFEQALACADPAAREWRAEVLVELGNASLWAMNMPAVYTRARAADALVGELGRPDLALAAGGMLAQCLASEGKIDEAIAKYDEVRARRGARHVPSMSLAALTLYWKGRVADAISCANETLEAARTASDIVSVLVGLPPLGMALAAEGRYREAAAAFAEARAIGERHRAMSLLARAVSMSTGFHLDLGDVDTAEDLATEAREIARGAGWSPGAVSAGIDLVVCRLRRGDVGAAEALIAESARSAAEIRGHDPATSGFHDWLWTIRLAWARAEVALARGQHELAERAASEALALSEKGRPKYAVAALVTRAAARARDARAPEPAVADLDRAIAMARSAGDPLLFLRAALPRQALDGSDALAREIAAHEARIEAARRL